MNQETLMTDGQNTQDAGQSQQTASNAAEGQQVSGDQPAATTQHPTTEGQDSKAGDQGAQEDQQQGAPEKYEFTAPDGNAFDESLIGPFSEVAKELNLSQDSAQKMLDKMAPVLAGRQAEQIAAIQSEWATSARADKEFGGDGLQENLAVAKQALEAFGTDELKTFLKQSGLGNHPEIIRAFYRAGKAVAADTFVGGQARPNSTKSLAERLYS